jgi:phospholipid N-methyltransferase
MIAIDEILTIIQPMPGLKILETGCGAGVVTERLAEHLAAEDGEIDLFEYMPDGETVQKLETIPNLKFKAIDSYDKTIRPTSREYETAIVTLLLNKIANPAKLLEACYHSLENSGTFLALCKEGDDDIQAIETLLDEAHFVAMNRIDMKDGYFLATAKKMHHWGRGL